MKADRIITLVIVCLLAGMCFARPPKVIKMYPENGAIDVKPGPIKIRILFDQDMGSAGHSLCGGGENFPEFIGQPKWAGRRAFVFSANLKPDHEYTFSINCSSAQNFKSVSGEPAEVMFVTFYTAGEDGTPNDQDTLTTEKNLAAFDAMKVAITKNYSYRDLKGLDWEALLDEYKPQLLQAGSPEKFVSITKILLGKAKDKHIWFKIGDKTIPCYINPVTPNANLPLLPKLVPDFKKHNANICTGKFPDGIGYIYINSWNSNQKTDYNQLYIALNEFSDAPGLIIDVRGNGGGAEPLAREFAGCFIDKPKLYAKNINIDPDNPGQFAPVHERYVQPNQTKPQYHGKIAVLIGPVVMSSCEAFVLMMKQVPGCILVGEPTQGSSGNPQPYDLGNGVTVFLPCWKSLLPDGTCFEGKGIRPDILVKTTPDKITTTDPIIEAALKELRL